MKGLFEQKEEPVISKSVDIGDENAFGSGPRLLTTHSGVLGVLSSWWRRTTGMQVFVMSLSLIILVGGVFLYMTWDSGPEGVEPEIVTPITSSGKPHLANIPPGYANIGEEFEFTLRFTDSDSELDKLEVVLLDGPDWMHIDEHTLYGTPVEESSPEVVKIEISDGEHTVLEKFFIVSREKAE